MSCHLSISSPGFEFRTTYRLVVLLNRRAAFLRIDNSAAEPTAGRALLDSDPPAATAKEEGKCKVERPGMRGCPCYGSQLSRSAAARVRSGTRP
jgi:hypothetical protein